MFTTGCTPTLVAVLDGHLSWLVDTGSADASHSLAARVHRSTATQLLALIPLRSVAISEGAADSVDLSRVAVANSSRDAAATW